MFCCYPIRAGTRAGDTHEGRRPPSASDDADVLGFLALSTGADVELDRLALFERAVAVALDRREVDEDVVGAFTGDEPVALLRR